MNELINDLREENAKLREEVEILKNKRLSLIDALSSEASTCMTWQQRAEKAEAELEALSTKVCELAGVIESLKAGQNKRDIEQQIKVLESGLIPDGSKYKCIGEFKIIIENGRCCPECWHEQSEDCEICGGESDENGMSDASVTVPWDLCKSIWLTMNEIKAQKLRKELEK